LTVPGRDTISSKIYVASVRIRRGPMSNSVYRKVELVGASASSLSDAINNAVTKAAEEFQNLGWFEVQEIRGNIQDGKVSQYQVVLKVGFRI
jgi:flavin-binding protein dodecin